MHRSRHHDGRHLDDFHGFKRLFWGATLIATGIVFLLDRQGIVSMHEVWRLWPAAIALFGIARIVTARRFAHVAKGLFLIMLGAWLFICIEQIWGWTFATTWPIIVIAFGLKAVAAGLFGLRQQSRKESA